MLKIVTKNCKETQKIASLLAEEIQKTPPRSKAAILALAGNLGSGKTAFTQAFAGTLGIKEKISSPTFVLMKIYEIPCNLSLVACYYKHLIHVDCYRLNKPAELEYLGFKNILKDRDAIVVVEWANRVRKLIPKNAVWIEFQHGEKKNERVLKFLYEKTCLN